MSSRAKILTLVAAVAVAVGAFVALRPGSDTGDGTTPARTAQATTDSTGTAPTATTPAQPVVRRTVKVGADGPADGVAEIRANAGDRVVIKVVSTGYSGEVHLHGFDVMHDVAPGKPAVFEVSSRQTSSPSGQGSFEMELEAVSVQVAKLFVSP